jgi:hypothetical protein
MSALLLDALWWTALVTLTVGWLVALGNAGTFPRLAARMPARPSSRRASTVGERVSLLVPARDEAGTLPATLPGMLAQGADEVIVLDDGSRDDTAAVVTRRAGAAPALRLLHGAPLPRGWSGKNWACHQLAQAARGEVLVFTDADVRWQPGALTALLAERDARGADLVTCWPRQRCETLGERLVVPLVDLLLLTTLPAVLARRRWPLSLTGANGQCMLWDRDAYRAVGGHEAVRAEVLEDVRLAQGAKAAGRRVALTLGAGALEVRMYRGYREVVRGFAKNALAAAGGRPWALVVVVALNLLTYSAVWPLALHEPRWWPLALAGVGLRALTNAVSRRPVIEAALQPLAPLALLPVTALALAWRGGYEWRGRRYA